MCVSACIVYVEIVSELLVEMSIQTKDPFTLTYVTYACDKDGTCWKGQLMALLTLTPIFIIVALTTTVCLMILFERPKRARDGKRGGVLERRGLAVAVDFLCGQLVNDALSRALKMFMARYEIGKEMAVRPSGSDRDEYGLPSNHSQSVAFFATYAILTLLRRRAGASYGRRTRSPMVRNALIAALATLSISVSYSRIFLEYHTIPQVVFGFVLGIFTAYAWCSTRRGRVLFANPASLLSRALGEKALLDILD